MARPPAAEDGAAGSEQVLSAAEARFERTRQTIGLFLGPAAFVVLLLFPPGGLAPSAARLAAVIAWVITWWITEPVPIPVTALLGPALAVVLGVGSAKDLLAPFGDPIIFLFLGGFLIAEAMVVHGLDRRIAFAILGARVVGGRPERIVAGFIVLSAGLSMWMSNTATTAMLYPIALGVIAGVGRLVRAAPGADDGTGRSPYARGLLLCCAYGSSIGGIGTPVGTPPNLIAIGQLGELAGARLSFVDWMLAAMPVMLAMLAFTLLYVRRAFPAPVKRIAGAVQFIADERQRLGPRTRGQTNVIVVFIAAVTLWVLPGLVTLLGDPAAGETRSPLALPEGVAAVIAASLLFVLPVDWRQRRFTLAWRDAVRIDWGTLLLFGGGLSLGGAMFRTGLAEAFGSALTSVTGARSTTALTFVFAVFAIYFTEVTSNTATATMLVPLAIAAAKSAGVSAVPPALGCALGCSMAFMLPVATPPNAIVYGSGLVPITSMVRAGFWMNIAASVIVPGGTLVMCALLGL